MAMVWDIILNLFFVSYEVYRTFLVKSSNLAQILYIVCRQGPANGAVAKSNARATFIQNFNAVALIVREKQAQKV